MAESDSIQHTISRVRPPRVQITYDVEIGDAIQMKELPFVMGIIADLSGDRDPEREMPKLKERQFTEIDRDNFNDTMASIRPRLEYTVPNTMTADGEGSGNIAVELEFRSVEDFEPVNVINQVDSLRQLYETRKKLVDLVTKLDGNDDLDALLREMIENDKKQGELKKLIEASRKSDEEGDG